MFTESIPAAADRKMKDGDGLNVGSEAKPRVGEGNDSTALKTNRNHQSRV